MPLFGSSSQFDADVEKATSEVVVQEDWGLFLDICDKAKNSSAACKDLLRAIVRRMKHPVPHVVKLTLSLLNSCVKNCGRNFLLEVASRDFVEEMKIMLSDKTHPKLSEQLRLMIKSWSENEFKTDSALSIIPSFYYQLKVEGYDFSSSDKPVKQVVISKDPNVVQSQEEEDDIAKAIAESLKDVESHRGSGTRSSNYNSTTSSSNSTIYPAFNSSINSANNKPREPRKVRALYDFEAVEDNELTFKAGEIIGVIDDSDANWWKGTSWRGEGLFPANFVTLDLDTAVNHTNDKPVKEEPAVVEVAPTILTIDEDKIDHTLIMLQNADPTGENCPDPADLPMLEDQCRRMNPIIDQELEKVDKTHMKLSAINTELMNSLQLYHSLMTEQTLYPTGPGAYAVTNPQTLNSSSAPYQSFDQMMNTQQTLSLSQISHIQAQVGPSPSHSSHQLGQQQQVGMMPGQQQPGAQQLGQQQFMQQSLGPMPGMQQQQLGMTSTVQYAPGTTINSVQYAQNMGSGMQGQYQTTNIPPHPSVYHPQEQQQQQPIYSTPHQMR